VVDAQEALGLGDADLVTATVLYFSSELRSRSSGIENFLAPRGVLALGRPFPAPSFRRERGANWT